MPQAVFKKLGDQGLLGIKVPVEYGGLDLDWMTLGLVTEQLAYYDFSLGMGSCSRTSLGMLPIIRNGTEEQKNKYLPGLVQGVKTHCFATVEPNAGSDATAIETTAILGGDEYVISGFPRSLRSIAQWQLRSEGSGDLPACSPFSGKSTNLQRLPRIGLWLNAQYFPQRREAEREYLSDPPGFHEGKSELLADDDRRYESEESPVKVEDKLALNKFNIERSATF